MVRCGVVWCGVWCADMLHNMNILWCGVVWCGVVWCGVVWCGDVWCGVVWCGVVNPITPNLNSLTLCSRAAVDTS